jgi:hypothetical protein
MYRPARCELVDSVRGAPTPDAVRSVTVGRTHPVVVYQLQPDPHVRTTDGVRPTDLEYT